tara:strand:+ start:73 stop:825 length:753 start_codon:yes stop_codon:yes gene_type:complete
MKKTILLMLCMVFSVSIFSQIPPIVVVTEFEAQDQEKAFQLLNDLKELEKSMAPTPPRIFILREMDGNTVYMGRAFNSLAEHTKYNDERWADDGWGSEMRAKFREKNGSGAFDGTGIDVVMNHAYRMIPELSYVPEGMDLNDELPKNPYRRHVSIAVNWGERNTFINNIKAGIENDKKLGNKYIRLMLRPIFGGEDNADFMMVVLGESRAGYFTGLEERTAKREADGDWQKIQANPIASWVNEESLMITY